MVNIIELRDKSKKDQHIFFHNILKDFIPLLEQEFKIRIACIVDDKIFDRVPDQLWEEFCYQWSNGKLNRTLFYSIEIVEPNLPTSDVK
jgi:hypothetical protein